MDFLIKLVFVLLIFTSTMFFQVQNQEWDITRSLLKDANNMAVHDASQELDMIALGQGNIIIDPNWALETFKDTLEGNLGLDANLTPLAGSRLNASVKIVDFRILDDSNTVFPILYEDAQYGITKYLSGPAVVAVIETKHPVLIARSRVPQAIRVPAIYEYKENK
ncbi:hypothetical protein [Paenibacillus ihuae]|uniref:hypothetical protein n=1 Tax=Paenibacillus ihuae TaxID=1232431 RepID=UPI0006D55686|nr:hypothetical protein [Paenibacillus ihuae]